jgi:simple sugar transport system permease protein
MKEKKGVLSFIAEHRFLQILISIFMGFLVGAVFLVIMGLSVGEAYGRLLASITNLKGFYYLIVYSTSYIVVGLSVAFSFKTGVFNIGAEGQFVVGSMAAACIGILCGNLPGIVLIPLCFLAAMAAGAIWGSIVGFLKTKWGINEVLSMIMFNWIAFYLSNFIAGIPAIHSDGSAESTKNIAAAARTLLPQELISRLDIAPTAN